MEIRNIKTAERSWKEIKIDNWWIEMSSSEIAAFEQMQKDLQEIKQFQHKRLNRLASFNEAAGYFQTLMRKCPCINEAEFKKEFEKIQNIGRRYHLALEIKGLYHHIIKFCQTEIDNSKPPADVIALFNTIKKFLFLKAQGKTYCPRRKTANFFNFIRRILQLSDEETAISDTADAEIPNFLPARYQVSPRIAAEVLRLLTQNADCRLADKNIYHEEIKTCYYELCKQAHRLIPLLIAKEHYYLLRQSLWESQKLYFNKKSPE